MSKIVISVEMTFTNETEEKVLLTKVVNALQEDITERYTDFCKKNNVTIQHSVLSHS